MHTKKQEKSKAHNDAHHTPNERKGRKRCKQQYPKKRRSPVETGDLNDCLPYEKTLRVGCCGD
jgi:hypothetical protein